MNDNNTPSLTKAEYALFFITDGWRKHEIQEETGCDETTANQIWEQIERVREMWRNGQYDDSMWSK